MNKSDLIYCADQNFAEFHREMARWNSSSEIVEYDDLLFVAGADNSPVTNCSMRLGPGQLPAAAEAMSRIDEYFRLKNRAYSIYIRQHIDSDLEKLCESSGMNKIANSAGMFISEPVKTKPELDDIVLKEVQSISETEDFTLVSIESFSTIGMPVETGNKIFAHSERMLKPYNYMVVACINDKPVSCAMILFSHSIAGVYWVGTVESARNKGLGEACTAAVTNEAFRRGASSVILQASVDGEPIYKRMGYTEFSRYPWYMNFNTE